MSLFSKNKPDNKNNKSGSFISFVLLDKPQWDMGGFVSEMRNQWGIEISPEDAESKKDDKQESIVFFHKNMTAAVSYIAAPVPKGEAEHYAAANYMWKDAVNITRGHKAQVIIAVVTGDEPVENAEFMVKAVCAALKQDNACAVYSEGAVYEPKFYTEFAAVMKNGTFPLFNLIWLGLYRTKKFQGFYTYGMKRFGKDEIELYTEDMNADLNEMRVFLGDIVLYVIEGNVTLNDGETIGMTAEQKLPIKKSRGIALEGKTLKIPYEP